MKTRRLHPGFFTALWLLPILGILQTSLFTRLAFRGTLPGIMLIVIVDWGILRGTEEGMIWALFGGLCLDVFTGLPFGTNTVAMVCVASLVSLGGGTFIRTHVLLPPATVLGATLIYYLIIMFILESTQHHVSWIAAIEAVAIPVALYNAILNIPGFFLVRRLESRIYPMPRANW